MILVTGGAGLLGHTLISMLLAEGEKLKAIFHTTPLQISHPNLDIISCDILDVTRLEEVMAGVTEVYHCAGYVSFAPDAREKLFKINAEGTANVVNAALTAGVRKLVHVSSVAALGRIREGETVNETMHWSEETSNSKYGQSKYYGEMEVWRSIAEGLNAAIVNPVVILGAGNWNDSSTKIFRSAYEEFPWYAEGVSGFVYVKDVAKAMILLMKSDVTAERFIISAENRSYREIFNMIADAFGKKRPYKKVTPFFAAFSRRIEAIKSAFSGRAPLVTKETAATALAHVEFDNNKFLKSFPGFSYTPLQQAITETCRELQQNINK